MTELKEWLTLIRTPGLGARRLHPLIHHFKTPGAILSAGSRLRTFGISQATITALANPDHARVEADLNWLQPPHHHLIHWHSNDYPPQLRTLSDPPLALFAIGDPATLWLPQLAVVGSRNATRGGLDNTRAFAALIARQQVVITSGLALGVDGEAHRAALQANGQTVAVAATGLDRVYPAKHRELAAKIMENGAIVSEFPPGTEPRPGHFPSRNRIISGLSLGTLVVEAGLASGSLITARQAIEQGRDVFAIPGSIHNPLARGCHRLIKQGAKLVESAEDLFEELAPQVRTHIAQRQLELSGGQDRPIKKGQAVEASAEQPNLTIGEEQPDDDYQQLLHAIGFDPTTIDQLVERTRLTAEAVSSMLLILELDGKVHSEPGGGYYRRDEQARSAS